MTLLSHFSCIPSFLFLSLLKIFQFSDWGFQGPQGPLWLRPWSQANPRQACFVILQLVVPPLQWVVSISMLSAGAARVIDVSCVRHRGLCLRSAFDTLTHKSGGHAFSHASTWAWNIISWTPREIWCPWLLLLLLSWNRYICIHKNKSNFCSGITPKGGAVDSSHAHHFNTRQED